MRASTAALAALVGLVAGHGNITSPPARLPGPAMAAACGQQAVKSLLQDGTLPLEDVLGTPASCQLDLCRGAKFADNANRVQTFFAGQVVPMRAILPIPHEGPMNVSIVSTATNKVVAGPLISFASYADEKLKVLPANNTAFSVTIPRNLAAGACTKAGECVLQWFWFGTAAKQTYESCVDFVMGKNGTSAGGVGTGAGTGTGSGAGNGTGSTGSTGSGSGSPGSGQTGTGAGTGTGSTGSGAGSTTGSGSTTPGTGSGSVGSTTPSGPAAAVIGPPLPGDGIDAFGGVVGSINIAP